MNYTGLPGLWLQELTATYLTVPFFDGSVCSTVTNKSHALGNNNLARDTIAYRYICERRRRELNFIKRNYKTVVINIAIQ